MRNSSLSKHGCGIQILINSGFKETTSASTSKRQDAISVIKEVVYSISFLLEAGTTPV